MKIEVSNGELVDRYTILLIKKKKTNPFSMKFFNIHENLSNIKDMVNSLSLKEETIEELMNVNRELWDVEDKLRLMEKEKKFDEEFITLARSVYTLNDKRYAIKRNIDEITKSDVREEKILPSY
jgi:predicted nuclease with TOPRIM domain